MNILVPDEWLRNFLKTSATPKKIAEYLSLSGPTVDKLEKKGNTHIYYIEVTTNRVDTASVYGIARESAAILPRFGEKASLAKAEPKLKQKFVKKVDYLDAKVDNKLCPRFTSVLIENVKIKKSPEWMRERLEWVGVRPINNIIDISNYIMHEIGQPVHTFNYDKILGAKMILRESKKGEVITTLDGQTHKLPGGDIVIEDGKGRLIDLAGIMGAENSSVGPNTKNVLLFVQTYNSVVIRKTSMALPKRTEAAVLFEKGLDTENVTLGIGRGIELFEKLTGGKANKEILDIYPNPYRQKQLSTSLIFIEKRLGVEIEKREVSRLLNALEFETKWSNETLNVAIPSFRAEDISIPEDIVEEIARIYGYHKLPSRIMEGSIPEPPPNMPFEIESKVRKLLKGYGGVEVYTYSLVDKTSVDKSRSLKLKNPLGKESEYLRTSLIPSLTNAANDNKGEKEPFFLFEIANVYLPRRVPGGTLPDEKMMLGAVFSNYSYREAKGILEALLKEINIKVNFVPEDSVNFLPARRVKIMSGKNQLGQLGILETNKYIYFELEMEVVRKFAKPFSTYTPLPKYPPQIEDITLKLPPKTKVADIISSIKSVKFVRSVELTDIYKDAYTFRVLYQDDKKTLTDKEVEEVRTKMIKVLKKKFGVTIK